MGVVDEQRQASCAELRSRAATQDELLRFDATVPYEGQPAASAILGKLVAVARQQYPGAFVAVERDPRCSRWGTSLPALIGYSIRSTWYALAELRSAGLVVVVPLWELEDWKDDQGRAYSRRRLPSVYCLSRKARQRFGLATAVDNLWSTCERIGRKALLQSNELSPDSGVVSTEKTPDPEGDSLSEDNCLTTDDDLRRFAALDDEQTDGELQADGELVDDQADGELELDDLDTPKGYESVERIALFRKDNFDA